MECIERMLDILFPVPSNSGQFEQLEAIQAALTGEQEEQDETEEEGDNQ